MKQYGLSGFCAALLLASNEIKAKNITDQLGNRNALLFTDLIKMLLQLNRCDWTNLTSLKGGECLKLNK